MPSQELFKNLFPRKSTQMNFSFENYKQSNYKLAEICIVPPGKRKNEFSTARNLPKAVVKGNESRKD